MPSASPNPSLATPGAREAERVADALDAMVGRFQEASELTTSLLETMVKIAQVHRQAQAEAEVVFRHGERLAALTRQKEASGELGHPTPG